MWNYQPSFKAMGKKHISYSLQTLFLPSLILQEAKVKTSVTGRTGLQTNNAFTAVMNNDGHNATQ
jgi:hypothetical protein